jgi:hypothetical protein
VGNPEIGGVVWLLPLIAYLGRQPGLIESLYPTFRTHVYIGILFAAFTVYELTAAGVAPRDSVGKAGLLLLYPAPFLLLANLASGRYRFANLLGLGLAAAAHYFLSNRAAFGASAGVAILAIVLGRRSGHMALTRLALLSLGAAAAIVFLADQLLAGLSDDWLTDTRSFLWEELAEDFGYRDWIIGRGALGEYYSPYFAYLYRIGQEGDWMYRQVNEIGYLHIILKAGLVGVVLYSVVMLRATLIALRAARSRFYLGLSLILLIHLLELSVIGQATFQPARVLLWILVGHSLGRSQHRLLVHK